MGPTNAEELERVKGIEPSLSAWETYRATGVSVVLAWVMVTGVVRR
jgi:hypothetical protein